MAQQLINLGVSPNDGTGDSLRAGGNKINLNTTELYSFADNRVFTQYVNNLNFELNIPEQLANWLNTTIIISPGNIADGGFPFYFDIGEKDIIFFIATKYVPKGIENHVYAFSGGKGRYGANSDSTAEAQHFSKIGQFFTSTDDPSINEIIDLGEIGSTPIEDVVSSGPTTFLEGGKVYIFQGTRDGETYEYYYTGPQGLNVGNPGNYMVTDQDFIELSSPEQPSLDDYVTQNEFQTAMYDRAKGVIIDLIENVDFSDGYNFYAIEADDNKVYFASKQTNVEDMEGSRIYIKPDQKHYDLSAPTLTQDGYDIWLLGTDPATQVGSNNWNNFDFWIKKSDSHYVGNYPTEADLINYNPTANEGDTGIVNTPFGDLKYTYWGGAWHAPNTLAEQQIDQLNQTNLSQYLESLVNF